MSDSLDEKWLLEESAASDLVDALNLKYGTYFWIKEHNDRPDIVIEEEKQGITIGVEVTHLFYDSEEARRILGRSMETEQTPENIDECLRRLNALLLQKSEKSRSYDHNSPLALLVRVVSRMFKMEDFELNLNKVMVPESDFHYIWLLFYDFDLRCWSGLVELKKI